jgi:hypothetical protein
MPTPKIRKSLIRRWSCCTGSVSLGATAVLWAMVLQLGAIGCSTQAAEAAPSDPLASTECTAYLASYRSCICGMSTPAVAEGRMQALRESLRGRGGGDSSAIRKACAAEQNNLQRACP